jgi:tRNA-specific 2-thiouridylase
VGLSFYTLGQRQGLGIGGIKAKGAAMKALQARGLRGAGEHTPWFVARKDIPNNTLWVVQGHDHPWLLSTQLHATDVSWCADEPPSAGAYAAKTRYRQADAACSFAPWVRADGQAGFALDFSEAQWAVTPGQSAVLYDGDVCLGGGVITSLETAPA